MWQRVRLRRWGRSKHVDLTAIKEFFNWYARQLFVEILGFGKAKVPHFL